MAANDIAARAAALGIDATYIDARGVPRQVPDTTLQRLSSALAADATLAKRATLIWRCGRTESIKIGAQRFRWEIRADGFVLDAGASGDGRLVLGQDLPWGTHRLLIQAMGGAQKLNLIVAPQKAYQLDDARADRIWLLTTQLYGVRSARNWGHGDFTDLRNFLRLAAEVGAAGVGVNPLHALFDDRPEQASPYSPNSRLFLNPLYIDVDAIPEFIGAEAGGYCGRIEPLRNTEVVDYPSVAAVKHAALRQAYAAFPVLATSARRADFQAFRHERGETLARFAAFELLRRRFAGPWWEWPREWRRPTDAQLAKLRAEADPELCFHEFVQWIADRQLCACRDEARRLNLPIGLYLDIAVGVEPNGADAWGGQASIVRNAEVGAPPDLLNTEGQAWGLAAYSPAGLEAQAFAPFREMLRAAMRYAGAVRIDHVLGLNRLFLVPFGVKASDGAYARYPLQALLAAVAIESAAHRCLVIGEDLGTVPEDLREKLADWGVWSYLVMLFERGADGGFKAPTEYARNALATFSTHDLASFAGWQRGHDLSVKRALEIDPGETDKDRRDALWRFGEALAKSDVSRDRPCDFVDAVRFLARTPSRVLAVAVEDMLGVVEQPNVPGTVNQHPNWRRRLPVALENLAQHHAVQRVAQALAEEGRSFRPPQ